MLRKIMVEECKGEKGRADILYGLWTKWRWLRRKKTSHVGFQLPFCSDSFGHSYKAQKKQSQRTMDGFLPLLDSAFHWDNGATKWQQSSEGREGRKGRLQSEIEQNGGSRPAGKVSSLLITMFSFFVLPSAPNPWHTDRGVFREPCRLRQVAW